MKTAVINITIIGLGGFLGAIARYTLGGLVHHFLPNGTFPYGTVAVNLIGCLIISFLSGLVEFRQLFTPELRLFLLIGLLGGFTTFSTFSFETIALIQDSEIFRAIINVLIHVIGGLIAVWFGYNLVRYF